MWPALIQGGLGLLGGIFSSNQSGQNSANQIQAQEAMQSQSETFNAEQAQENRDFQASQVNNQELFQQSMSNTAYQRAAADMQKAGLNPAMMFGSGSAASAPAGSAASGSVASIGTPNVPTSQKTSAFGNLGQIVKDSVGTAVAQTTMDKMVQETANLKTLQAKIAAETVTEGERPGLVRAETKGIGTETATKEALMPEAKARGEHGRLLSDIYGDPIGRRVIQGGVLGKSATDIVRPAADIASLGVWNSALKAFNNRSSGIRIRPGSELDRASRIRPGDGLTGANDNSPFGNQ